MIDVKCDADVYVMGSMLLTSMNQRDNNQENEKKKHGKK